jgi:hypothetical protein
MTCTPDPVTAAALQARLDEALAAYHELMTGTSARVVVDQNGQRVEYAVANAARLNAYILSLKTQLGFSVTDPCGGGLIPSAPAGFLF